MTFSGLTLAVRLMCLVFSWNAFHEIHESQQKNTNEFHEIAVTFFFFLAATVLL